MSTSETAARGKGKPPMKKLLLGLVLLLMLPGTASASTTITFTGTWAFHDQLVGYVSTTTDAPLSAIATFAPKNTVYMLWVESTTDAAAYCRGAVDDRWGRNDASEVSCSIALAPAGTYRISFYPWSGKANATVVVSGEVAV